MPFRRILFPVDVSRGTPAWIRSGVEIAAAADAELWLLHVIDEGPAKPSQVHEWQPVPSDFAALPLRTTVLRGNPAGTIAAFAGQINADLILMASRGHGVIRQLFQGSTTMDVLRRTERPVWVAKQRQPIPESGFQCRRILCGVQLGSEGQAVLNYAARIAADWGSELVIVHVIPETSEAMLMMYGLDETGEIELAPAVARQKLARLAANVSVPYETSLMIGDVGKGLQRAAKKYQADLVIVGRGRQESRPRIGSNIGEIVKQSRCPVITCPGSVSAGLNDRDHPSARTHFQEGLPVLSPVHHFRKPR